MPEDDFSLVTFSHALCPWLREPYLKLESARVAGRLGHAWLLSGPVGIGKLNLALVMAQRLLLPGAAPGSLSVEDARSALSRLGSAVDHHPDLYRVSPEEDRQTIGVEQIREIGLNLSLKSLRGTTKVVIIEPAEAMTVAAANALLKTLEEPTPDTYLWLVSHQPGRLPATIRSRCQRMVLRAPSSAEASAWLGIPGDSGALAPLRIAELEKDDLLRYNNQLEDIILKVSRGELDAQQVADDWIKWNLPLALEWLAEALRLAIRARSMPRHSNLVTDSANYPLHNAWSPLKLDQLFALLAATERLLDQRGRGLNEALAVRVLLLGFQPR
jgi:DNA polymerase-3 subunit delta'